MSAHPVTKCSGTQCSLRSVGIAAARIVLKPKSKGKSSIQIDIYKGWCTADMDRKVKRLTKGLR